MKVFHIETVLNNRMFSGPLDFLMKNEDDFTEADTAEVPGHQVGARRRLPFALRREIFMRTPAAYELIACTPASRAGPRQDLAKSWEQYSVRGRGPGRHLITGIPYISPYNVNSKALNPLLVQVMALGYFYNMYRGKCPLKREGRRRSSFTHPCYGQVRPGPPPELHRVLQPPAARDHATAYYAREEVPGRVRLQPDVRRDVPARQRLSRRAPVLHVVLGPARSRATCRG
jgi:hypothetical protein